jgi:acetyl esterase/lipase
MKHIKFLIITIFILFVIIGCSNESNDEKRNALEYFEELDIAYGNNPEQKFDLYLPANRTQNTKTLILVHGGGWNSGDKADMNLLISFIRQDLPDVAIVNINYRLANEGNSPYPMQIDDISSVVSYIKTKKSEYSISNRFGFVGISAGAHLSLLWSYAFDSEKNVSMVASVVGPTNFTDPAYLNNNNPEVDGLLDLFGITPEIEFLKEISPLYQVTSSSPPTTLFYAEEDQLVPLSQGIDLRDKLIDLNVAYQFKSYPNVGHGLGIVETLDVWANLKNFINTHL